ncbi:Caspase-3 [Oopsacas minuta]|uniref:Caspase-3 n=1 Tax=Oopsacas minuta TaxID=111878 RepID=A0AAV7JX01_9METZ|nr:Caspase-3 [Oopsacas minuta]
MAERFRNPPSTAMSPTHILYSPLRTPPPNQQEPAIYPQVTMNNSPDQQPSINFDVSKQCVDNQKILLPPLLHKNMQRQLDQTPQPTSIPHGDDSIFSDIMPYQPLKDTNYEMPNKDERGIGAIFVNTNFAGGETRPGVGKDIDNLDKIFTMMQLKVYKCEEKTSQEILKELKQLAKEVTYKHYMLCVAFSTHGGENDILFGSDRGRISLRSEILPIFNPENCPVLEGKPKIFIIQACRGDKSDYLTNKVYFDAMEKDPIVSLETDYLISYACTPDYKAYRTKTEGAWFLNELFNTYKEYSDRYHFMDILTLTNHSLMLRCNRERDNTKVAQPSHFESTLKKFLLLKSESNVRCLETELPSRSEMVQSTGPLALDPGTPVEHVPFFPQLFDPKSTDTDNHIKVYDWDNKNVCIGDLIQHGDKQYLKHNGLALRPQFDCLPSYHLEGDQYTGLGVIIVNEKCGSTERLGAKKDLEHFEHIFKFLRLKIITKTNICCNKKGDELGFKEFIKNVVKDNAKMRSVFIAISTHGAGPDKLACFDGGDIEVSFILNILQEVDHLVGKPKVLFIQACRGDNMDSQIVSDSLPEVATRQTDLFVAYSCVEGYKAWRDKDNGSWFVTSLRECFDEMHGHSNILDLLTATSNHMLQNYKHDTDHVKCIKQPPEVRHTLCAQLFI